MNVIKIVDRKNRVWYSNEVVRKQSRVSTLTGAQFFYGRQRVTHGSYFKHCIFAF